MKRKNARGAIKLHVSFISCFWCRPGQASRDRREKGRSSKAHNAAKEAKAKAQLALEEEARIFFFDLIYCQLSKIHGNMYNGSATTLR